MAPALVIPILRNGSPVEELNHKNIRLTPILCNVFECTVKDAITGHHHREHLLPDTQHGFIAGLSCLTKHSMVTHLMHSGDDVDNCYLYFSKAFNFVNHSIIYAKLAAHGVSPQVADLVWIFLANRLFQVRIDDIISEVASVTSSVAQCFVIDPVLFLVMVSHILCDLQLFFRVFAGGTQSGGRRYNIFIDPIRPRWNSGVD